MDRWGCDHEKVASDAYIKQTMAKHTDFQCSEAGLFISVERPYLGASPDGLLKCLCCGSGVLSLLFQTFITRGRIRSKLFYGKTG